LDTVSSTIRVKNRTYKKKNEVMHEISKVGTIYNIFDMMKKRNMGV